MENLRKFLKNLSPDEQIIFAKKCGTTIKYLRKRLCDKSSRLGEKICIEIEDKTNGQVTCEELRPDVNWSVLRNKSR